MEEKKKKSRLRLFPSFSVKTGVFNKQVLLKFLMMSITQLALRAQTFFRLR